MDKKMIECLFCKIFVQTNESKENLIKKIGDLTQGTIEQWSVKCDLYVIGICKNDEFNREKYQEDDIDGFLFSKFLLEIEPIAALPNKTAYISSIGKLLEGLWRDGYGAVAACDFEDMLPNQGGYRMKNSV